MAKTIWQFCSLCKRHETRRVEKWRQNWQRTPKDGSDLQGKHITQGHLEHTASKTYINFGYNLRTFWDFFETFGLVWTDLNKLTLRHACMNIFWHICAWYILPKLQPKLLLMYLQKRIQFETWTSTSQAYKIHHFWAKIVAILWQNWTNLMGRKGHDFVSWGSIFS